MAGVILVMFLLFVVVAVFYVVENNPNNKTTKSKTESEGGGILSDKNQNDSTELALKKTAASTCKGKNGNHPNLIKKASSKSGMVAL